MAEEVPQGGVGGKWGLDGGGGEAGGSGGFGGVGKAGSGDLEDADAAPVLVRDVDEFAGAGACFELIPEAVDLAAWLGLVDDDVVESDEAAGADEGTVHIEVAFGALVGVVAIDEEEVDLSAGGEVAEGGEGFLGVGIGAEEVDLLVGECEGAEEG